MSLQLKQSIALSQSLVMTPYLQLGLKLLAMNRLELAQTLQTELIENPVLEEDDEELEWEQEVEYVHESQIYADAQSYIEQTLSNTNTLAEHLLWQVQMSGMNVIEREIANYLVGELDENGYLDTSEVSSFAPDQDKLVSTRCSSRKQSTLQRLQLLRDFQPRRFHPSIERIAKSLSTPPEWVEKVRHQVMRMHPIGCLALHINECLLVQLEALGFDEETIEHTIVSTYLHQIENRDYKPILRALHMELNDLLRALDVIKQLEPMPSRAFKNMLSAPTYIQPDLYIVPTKGEYTILFNDKGVPKLRLNQLYTQQMGKKDKAARFVKDQIRSAIWLIRSIQQRRKTILRVAEAILKRQRQWFDGHSPLRPLVLATIANDVGVHESTISRVTNGKFVHTVKGIYELKYFFSSACYSAGDTIIAGEAVRDAIKKIIVAENPSRPLSDFDIVARLKGQNIQIARRTVAKYRENLGILPSNKRKLLPTLAR